MRHSERTIRLALGLAFAAASAGLSPLAHSQVLAQDQAQTQAQAQPPNTMPALTGQVRLQHESQQANPAFSVPPGWASSQTSPANTLETELRSSTRHISGVVTFQQQVQGDATRSRAWVNELYASHDGGAWQFSAGKKTMSWDVGHGFRPNDMVQQETRLGLISRTLEGHPLLAAEHFTDSTAWTLVRVNPTGSPSDPGGDEPAWAARVYQRAGAVDWYGFARSGSHTGTSSGVAMAWVATESLELHASWRRLAANTHQAVLGGTWTTQTELSLLAETWQDDTAALPRHHMLRLSWQHDGWQPALEWLHNPSDGGRVVTASVGWQGDRLHLQGGLRAYGGPDAAAYSRLPMARQAYVAATLAF